MNAKVVKLRLHVEPVSRQQLDASTRRLLQLEEVEEELTHCFHELTRRWTKLKRLKKETTKERGELLERLARGAELAG